MAERTEFACSRSSPFFGGLAFKYVFHVYLFVRFVLRNCWVTWRRYLNTASFSLGSGVP